MVETKPTATTAPATTERLSWAEICERHPDEWVCIADIVHDSGPDPAIESARVIGHGKQVRQPLEQAEAWKDIYSDIGLISTGRFRGLGNIVSRNAG